MTSRFTVDEIEDAWSRIESSAGDVLRNVREGIGLDDADTVQAIKDLMCLHLTRSYETLDYWNRIREENQDIRELEAIIENDDLMRRYVFERTGLYAVGSEGLVEHREEWCDWINASLKELYSQELVKIYNGAKEHIAEAGLEVWNTGHGAELVIGDCPAFTVSADGERFGMDTGVSLNETATIVMPLGPYTLAGLGPRTGRFTLRSALTEKFNRIQCRRARKQVVCRPGSNLDDWVVQQYHRENA